MYDGGQWDTFYQAHPTARFFKERRYLLLEFPVLGRRDPPQHVTELGCGCGSSIIPVLRANPAATATVSDVSGTSVAQLLQAADMVRAGTRRPGRGLVLGWLALVFGAA